MTISRRAFLKTAALAGGAATLGLGPSRTRAGDVIPTPIRFRPFQAELPIPPVLARVAPFATAERIDPTWLKRPIAYYDVVQKPGIAQIIPGVETPIWGYQGIYPGPTIRARAGEPLLVRQHNELGAELSVHQHGGHTRTEWDGWPNDFIPEAGYKDYVYPMALPDGDPAEAPSTMWYHDHGMDVTGPHVYRGLAGFFLATDDVEDGLVERGVLPGPAAELPLLLQDRTLLADGQLLYDPFAHDGFLGDLMVVNGKVQPFVKVRRRKYRLRLLNGANARFFELALSAGEFLQVGADSWLLPRAVQRPTILLSGAERADVVVDFRNAPAEVFLIDLLSQKSGRGPGGNLQSPDRTLPGVPLLKFVVQGPAEPNDASVGPGTLLRPNTAIRADEVVATRTFKFVRRNGAWQINNQFFDPDRTDATPRLGTAERWILENGSGGWWHPIHIHLEAQQLQSLSGRAPRPWEAYNKDTHLLGPGDTAEVFIKFRTYPGKFAFHCHNTEHEDMRMMGRFDVVT